MESRPHYDPGRKTLSLSGVVVKHYHRPAQAQSLILDAFEQAGWPERIVNPDTTSEPTTQTATKSRLSRRRSGSLPGERGV